MGNQDDERTKIQHGTDAVASYDGTERKDRKQELAFYTGGKSDRVCDDEYDRDMQMKYRNNNDNHNKSEV